MGVQTASIEPSALPASEYAHLLGLYLGDGHLASFPRDVYRLSIACDARYPGLVDLVAEAVQTVLPHNKVRLVRHPVHRCVRVQCYSKLLPKLFRQHGPGRKHDRKIKLTDWQLKITRTHAEDLVRGLMHSDGSRFLAHQRVGDKVYAYVRYAFANRSDDIKAILCEHLDLLGIGWTRPNAKLIAIDRRAEVAKLDGFVGPKY